MKPQTLSDWISLYVKKTGEAFRLPPGYTLWAEHEHGFVMWKVSGEVLWMNQCSCDRAYWLPFIIDLAKRRGCKKIMAPTSMKEKSFGKVFGAEFVYEYEDGGVKHRVFSREVD